MINEMEVGARLYELRTENRFSQSELAKEVGVVEKTISNYEKAKSSPTIATLRKISEVLKVDIRSILFGKDEQISVDDIIDTYENNDVANALNILAQIDALRNEGDMHLKRKFNCYMSDARIALERLEEDEILEVLQERLDNDLDFEGLNDAEFAEYIERILDAASYGQDLYSIDLDRLNSFATANNIKRATGSLRRSRRAKWKHHKDIIPAIRAKLRVLFLNGINPFEEKAPRVVVKTSTETGSDDE